MTQHQTKIAVFSVKEEYPRPRLKLLGFVDRHVQQCETLAKSPTNGPLYVKKFDCVKLDFDSDDKWPVQCMWLYNIATDEEVNHKCVLVSIARMPEIPDLYQDENMTREGF